MRAQRLSPKSAPGLVLLALLLASLTALIPSPATKVAEARVLSIHPLQNGICTDADRQFMMIYANYRMTYPDHSQNQGQLANDYRAGEGAEISSPINATVILRAIDVRGNTILIIRNSCYEVFFAHGNYVVNVGQQVAIGNLLGYESNIGDTFPMWDDGPEYNGVEKCGKDSGCGFHSNVNVKDVHTGANLNAEQLAQASGLAVIRNPNYPSVPGTIVAPIHKLQEPLQWSQSSSESNLQPNPLPSISSPAESPTPQIAPQLPVVPETWLDLPVPGGAECSGGAPFGAANPAGRQPFHNARDFCKGRGEDIVAVASGEVVWADYWPASSQANHDVGHGVTVVIWHPDAQVYTYAGHLEENVTVKVGDFVSKGQVIGYMGSTGYANNSPHTHWGVRISPPSEQSDFTGLTWREPYDYLGKSLDYGQTTKPTTIGPLTLDVPLKLLKNVDTTVGQSLSWIWKASTFLILLAFLIFGIVASIHGVPLRWIAGTIGVICLLIGWGLPTYDQWLPNPFGDPSIGITTHYGDVRVDINGTTATSWEVKDGTAIKAVAPGVVLTAPDNMLAFGTEQLWIEVGNKLWLQYRFPSGTNITAKAGQHVSPGDTIASSGAGEISLGVSSKNPKDFTSPDDRSFGWIDPEGYLGKSILSGARKAEATFIQVGLILIIIALFWPGKGLKEEFPYPWGWKMARFQNVQLLLGLSILSLGVTLKGPWYLWIGGAPTTISLLYFIGRVRYRRLNVWRVPTLTYLGSILTLVAEFSFVLNMGVGALANPNLLFLGRAVALELPTYVTPSLAPAWMQEYVQAGGNPINFSTTSPATGGRPEEFQWTYWNGSSYRFYVPQEVWDAATKAYQTHGSCEPELMVALANSENNGYTNVCNSIGACGDYQFMPGTWDAYYPKGASQPSRLDREAIADAACRKLNTMGLSTATDKGTFRYRFTTKPLAESIWNAHDGQANFVWDTWQELKKRRTTTQPSQPSTPTIPNLSDWNSLDQATGVGLYQSGSNYLAIADLSKGARIVLTGGDSCASIEGHWNEMGANAFFVGNGTFFESLSTCYPTTFPFVKNGQIISDGAKTDSYPNARYLAIANNVAAVVPYQEWVNGNRATYMTAGLPPSAESGSGAWPLVGVSADGQLVFVLQVTSGTPQQGAQMLEALGVPEGNIILMDGGGSVQGKYRSGYTRSSGRPIPQGIGILAP